MLNSQQWLLIGLAGAWGYDKLDFTERLEKAQELRQLDPAGAESPAYAMAMLDGLGGNSRVRVHLDASASGIQCLAALANCEKSGTACNLFGSKCNDAYTYGISKLEGLDHIPRKLKKEAMMTSFYGSHAVPRDNLGKENLPAFYKMLQEEFTGAWNVFLTIQDQWRSDVTSHRWTMPDGFEVIQWNTVMKEETVELWGAKTIIRKKTKATQRRGLSLAAHTTHSTDALICREMVKRAQFDPAKAEGLLGGLPRKKHVDVDGLVYLYHKTGFLSVDLINALDQETYNSLGLAHKVEIVNLLEHLANKEKFFLYPVHDSFSAEARYCNHMVEMYRYLMQQLWDSTLLESIFEDISGVRPEHVKHEGVLDGVHMIS